MSELATRSVRRTPDAAAAAAAATAMHIPEDLCMFLFLPRSRSATESSEWTYLFSLSSLCTAPSRPGDTLQSAAVTHAPRRHHSILTQQVIPTIYRFQLRRWLLSVQFSSVTPRLTWCWVQALQDHQTVINVIHAVVAETEKFSEVAGMKTETERRWYWVVTRSMIVLLRPEMLRRQVKTGVWQEPQHRCWRPNAVSGENKSRTRAWSPLTSIKGRDHEDRFILDDQRRN